MVLAKVFGTGQNYGILFQADPIKVAEDIRKSTDKDNFIIDWKHSPTKDFEVSKKWLNSFVSALINLNKNVYIKAPASYFCYLSNNQHYLLSESRASKFIIEMYGQEPGVYTSY